MTYSATHQIGSGYQAILTLAEKLEKLPINTELTSLFDGYQITFYDSKNPKIKVADIIEHFGSFGSGQDLMESMGFSDDFGDVTGYLTVEDALEKVKRDFLGGE